MREGWSWRAPAGTLAAALGLASVALQVQAERLAAEGYGAYARPFETAAARGRTP